MLWQAKRKGLVRWLPQSLLYLSPQRHGWPCQLSAVITPRACARGKVIGRRVVSTKIARSGDLGVWATRKYSISVDIVEKLASLCFESFGKAHERRKYRILLDTPINTTLSAYAHNRAQYVGKGRQGLCVLLQVAWHGMELARAFSHRRCSARGMCSIEL